MLHYTAVIFTSLFLNKLCPKSPWVYAYVLILITTGLPKRAIALGPVVFSIHLCIIKNLIGRCCTRQWSSLPLYS
jgi:hypothetical protein